MEQTPDQLRKRAANIRMVANHAERLSDARDELREAERLEARADALEGKTAQQRPPIPPPTEADRLDAEVRRKARINDAIAKIAKQLGQA